jgi:hypothetical protein
LRKQGPRHTYAERQLMRQVADEFKKKKEELGAREAARQLGVSLPSFYNYVKGTDLPRNDVLLIAHQEWKVQWEHLDPSAILKTRKVTAEQLPLSLTSIRTQDVKIIAIGPKKSNVLSLRVEIRFSA